MDEASTISPRTTSLPVSLAVTLQSRISDGVYPSGSRLPSEPDLALQLGVSRPTLREALRVLARDGWLVRRHGSGTFVANRTPVPNSIEVNFGVSELIRSAGKVPGTSHLSYRIEQASGEIAERLGLFEGTPVEVLTRVRLADGAPVVHSVDYVPQHILPAGALVDPAVSLYELLASAGHPVLQGVAHLRAVLATTSLAKELGVARGAALMRIDQVDSDETSTAMVYSIEHHRPEAFDVVVRRHGPTVS